MDFLGTDYLRPLSAGDDVHARAFHLHLLSRSPYFLFLLPQSCQDVASTGLGLNGG